MNRVLNLRPTQAQLIREYRKGERCAERNGPNIAAHLHPDEERLLDAWSAGFFGDPIDTMLQELNFDE